MNFIVPIRHDLSDLSDPSRLDERIDSATKALLAERRDDGHWRFELEADATIPAEYILLTQYLDETPDLELEAKIGRYLRRVQGEHGGWALFEGGDFDVSATTKAYFALKMIGDDPAEPHMRRAREELLTRGGAAAANVFTRVQLALYGEISWNAVPTMPVELMLAPRWFPVHLSKMSYWARTVIAPLLVLMVKKPRARNPRGIGIRELFLPATVAPKAPKIERQTHRGWAAFFSGLDVVLKKGERLWPRGLRSRAIERAVAFTTERLNGEDGLGAIYPAIANSVMMYDALGYPDTQPDRVIARSAIRKLLVIGEDEAYCQPCVSPIWDTALAAHALLETGDPEAERAAADAVRWLEPRQILDLKGDWADNRPNLRPGGWAFQYGNGHYPDTDDTAVVLMAMDRVRPKMADGAALGRSISRGQEWIEGMQSRGGGWGAFDADNTYHYLNNIPFADHGALLDPPTVDVSARCVGMMAQLGSPDDARLKAGIAYLVDDQEADGSWFGRWGVNYIYGTWSALAGLNAAGQDPKSATVRRAVDWLVSIQNRDGGWGEDCDSYRVDYQGYKVASSTASQTAWALLGLMAAGEVDHEAVARGIQYLSATQAGDGLWPEESYTGGGFPRVFYLRYHGYAKYFPLWALARYRNLTRSNDRRVVWGI